MNQIKTFRTIYWAILAGIVLVGVVLEFIDVLDGIFFGDPTLEFSLQWIMILITLGSIYLALKMIKKNPIVRMALLEGPAIINILLYHGFQNASFGYLAIMCVIAYAFVYPSKVEDNELTNN